MEEAEEVEEADEFEFVVAVEFEYGVTDEIAVDDVAVDSVDGVADAAVLTSAVESVVEGRYGPLKIGSYCVLYCVVYSGFRFTTLTDESRFVTLELDPMVPKSHSAMADRSPDAHSASCQLCINIREITNLPADTSVYN